MIHPTSGRIPALSVACDSNVPWSFVYGLGHDEHDGHQKQGASLLGPRFHDRQLAPSADASWRECRRLRARDLLGEPGYLEVLESIEGACLDDGQSLREPSPLSPDSSLPSLFE